MEKNLQFNKSTKNYVLDCTIDFLIKNGMLEENELPYIQCTFGYIFEREDKQIEALFKINKEEKEIFIAIQDGKIKPLDFSNEMFELITSQMHELHECLRRVDLDETKEQNKRRLKNNKYLADKNIDYNEYLLCEYNDDEISIKSLDAICKRIICGLQAAEVAIELGKGKDFDDSLMLISKMFNKFDIKNDLYLTSLEIKMFEGRATKQDLIDIAWGYEKIWTLCWSVGLLNDKEMLNANQICNVKRIIEVVCSCNSYRDFIKNCKLRTKEEILDMQDIYSRYFWSATEKRINPQTNTNGLDSEIVVERKDAFDWLLNNDESVLELKLELDDGILSWLKDKKKINTQVNEHDRGQSISW